MRGLSRRRLSPSDDEGRFAPSAHRTPHRHKWGSDHHGRTLDDVHVRTPWAFFQEYLCGSGLRELPGTSQSVSTFSVPTMGAKRRRTQLSARIKKPRSNQPAHRVWRNRSRRTRESWGSGDDSGCSCAHCPPQRGRHSSLGRCRSRDAVCLRRGCPRRCCRGRA